MSQNDGDASRDHLIQSYLENQATQPDKPMIVKPPVAEAEVVFSLLLRTQEADPGLVVDRIRVTKRPAEGAELLQIR